MSRLLTLSVLAALVAAASACTMTRSEFEAIKEGVNQAGRQQSQQQGQQQNYRRPSNASASGIR